MNEEGFAVSEKQLTMAGNRILTAAHEAEKKALEKRHAIRVNQLIRETMQARYLLWYGGNMQARFLKGGTPLV